MKTAEERALKYLIVNFGEPSNKQEVELIKLLKEQDAESREQQDEDTRYQIGIEQLDEHVIRADQDRLTREACVYNASMMILKNYLDNKGVLTTLIHKAIMNTKAV